LVQYVCWIICTLRWNQVSVILKGYRFIDRPFIMTCIWRIAWYLVVPQTGYIYTHYLFSSPGFYGTTVVNVLPEINKNGYIPEWKYYFYKGFVIVFNFYFCNKIFLREVGGKSFLSLREFIWNEWFIFIFIDIYNN
jgi:hypothetical protein